MKRPGYPGIHKRQPARVAILKGLGWRGGKWVISNVEKPSEAFWNSMDDSFLR
jgi:hypothetical protein